MVVLMTGHDIRRTSIGVALLALLFAITWWSAPEAQDERRQIVEMSAERFAFYPSEIKAVPGTPIEFRLESEDTDHGFRILGTDIDVRIPKRGQGVATVTFRPAEPGKYTFECSHICGAGHNFMRGTILVAGQP
jgi:cytochrome c oxidase subunit 2